MPSRIVCHKGHSTPGSWKGPPGALPVEMELVRGSRQRRRGGLTCARSASPRGRQPTRRPYLLELAEDLHVRTLGLEAFARVFDDTPDDLIVQRSGRVPVSHRRVLGENAFFSILVLFFV